ncbi:hypothetical protein [Glycomyces sp. NRRL B-16210]|uniref:hypothetical protein n=1 Tax=Glycomyces sp. NRRL B-16210 TaxID=1463821 RepID=UPI0004C1C0F6|nr:hypothetical protein [Glycomyces sp. NRRL B-16210]
MSSPTIRYSGVPENSHSRDFESDVASYTRTSRHEAPDQARDSDLTHRFRAAAAADKSAGIVTTTDSVPAGPVDLVPGFAPGKSGPVSDDPRHNREYPHPKNPGLFAEVDGFYDWANRRLFLADGSPDPMTPGAYRYQTRPDLCDLDASDADPSSPRYEPDHLRHKPGDTWLIDKRRPYDVLDPGPFGSPGWFPDRRTGRHRRDELPDPIPWWEIEEEPEKAAWAEQAEALWERRTRKTRELDAREARERESESAQASRTEEPMPSDRTDPPGGSGSSRAQGGSQDRSRARAHESSQSRTQDDSEGGSRSGGPSRALDRTQGRNAVRPQSSETERAEPVRRPAPGPSLDEPYRFSKLREDAWDQFMIKSAPLAAAHETTKRVAGQTADQAAGQRDSDGSGRARWIVRRLADAVRRTRKCYRPPSRVEARPAGPQAPRRPGGPRPADYTAIALRTSQMASAFRGAERARTELAAARVVPDVKLGGAAWA